MKKKNDSFLISFPAEGSEEKATLGGDTPEVTESGPTAPNANHVEEIFPLPPFNAPVAEEMLVDILRAEILKTGIQKAVLGLSGGIDSALSYLLAVKALGAENVTAILMPYKLSSPESLAHARELLSLTGGPSQVVDLTAPADAYFEPQKISQKMRIGNVLARLRMVVLYDKSSELSALVVGTSNKTEILMGYSTLWGDMASAVNPLGDLFKSQVRALARRMGVPDSILKKPPSADLWEGQSDEAELQVSYDLADRVLYAYCDRYFSAEKIVSMFRESGDKASALAAERVLSRVPRSQFKRKMPLIAKVSHRTVNREFRYPRDWNL